MSSSVEFVIVVMLSVELICLMLYRNSMSVGDSNVRLS